MDIEKLPFHFLLCPTVQVVAVGLSVSFNLQWTELDVSFVEKLYFSIKPCNITRPVSSLRSFKLLDDQLIIILCFFSSFILLRK